MEVFMSNATRHEAFNLIGPVLFPSYFGASARDVEAAMALDEIRLGITRAMLDDISIDENVEDAKVRSMFGFNVKGE